VAASAAAGGDAPGGAGDPTAALAQMRSCVERLPAYSRALLFVLFQHMRDVVECEEDNRMSLQNLLITLGINISRSRRGAPNISPLRLMIEDTSIFDGVELPLGDGADGIRLDLACSEAVAGAGGGGAGAASDAYWIAVTDAWSRSSGVAPGGAAAAAGGGGSESGF